jgi:uncharacterized protein
MIRRGSGRSWLGAVRAAALALLFAPVLWAAAAPALAAPSFPALTGRVVDQAELLNPSQEAALTAKLAALEAEHTDQFVVVTVRSLEGEAIEDYGVQLGRHWKIGQQGANNGVILLVAPNERKVRIEVGYGLEPILTDALSSQIIQGKILPRFRDNDYPGGINAGADAIIEQLRLDPAEAQARAAKAAEGHGDGADIDTVIFIIIVVLVLAPHILVLLGILGLFGKRGRRWARTSGSSSGWAGSSSGWSSGSSSGGFSGGGGSFGGGGSSGGW